MKYINIPEVEAKFEVSNFAKIYPDKIRIYEYFEPFVKLLPGLELSDGCISTLSTPVRTGANMYLEDSLRRSATKVCDIVLCNRFDIFATFTFAKDRENIELCKKRMSKWLNHQKGRTSPDMVYLIIPEFHADKKCIHFHALMKGYDGSYVDSGHKQRGRTVYNITSYQHGFAQFTHVQDLVKTASYVRKYITKDMPQLNDKRRYWCSKNAIRPKIEYNTDYITDVRSRFVKLYELYMVHELPL
jgi:hypothetical protein